MSPGVLCCYWEAEIIKPKEDQEEVTDVSQYVDTATAGTINCRLFGHQWRPDHKGYIVEGPVTRPEALVKKLTCHGGCGCRAIDRYHPRSLDRLGSRSIDYPDGYLATGTKLPRWLVRQAEAATFGFGELAITTKRRSSRRARASNE